MLKKYNDGRMYLNGCQLLGEWGKIKAEEKNRLEYFCDAFDEYYGLLDRMYAIANHKFLYEKSGYKEIEKPAGVVHATMDRFFIKKL